MDKKDIEDGRDVKRVSSLLILTALATVNVAGCGDDGRAVGSSGLLEADEVIVSAETAGRVESIRFGEGSEIEEGDTLLIIDPSRLELELESALAGQQVAQAGLRTANLQLEKARESERFVSAERDRIAALVKTGTGTQKQLDQLEHEYAMAELGQRTARASITTIETELAKIETDINRIRRQLRDCYPVAPVKGTITEKLVERGELLAAGRPIARVSRLDTLWVKVYLPTSDFAEVKVGDRATVDTEAGGKEYSGEVVWTSEEAEFTPKNVQTRKSRTNLVYAVKVRVVNNDGYLKIGMPVFVTIER